PRGPGHRDAAVPGAAAPLCDRDRRVPRGAPDAARCSLDDADAGAAAAPLRAQHLVRLDREPAARPPDRGGDHGGARSGPGRGVVARAESTSTATPTSGAARYHG